MNLRRPWTTLFVTLVIIGLSAGPIPSADSTRGSSGSPQSVVSPVSRVVHSGASVLLPPHIIAACNVGLGETVVNSYTSARRGVIKLRCGDSASGYVHIRQRHQRDWQRVVDLAGGGGGNWDDLMDFITQQAIESPSPGYPKDMKGGKECYTTPALIFSSSGVVVRTLLPTVIVSRDNKKVITSIPTTGSPSCRGV